MSVHTSVTNSGLVSLSGFAYQMKVFLLLLSKTIEGQQVEFETLDDVVVSDIIDSNKEEDRCLKRIKTSDGHITAVQVKQTNVTPAISRKILHNWLLAYATEPSITSFSLYTEKNRTVSQAAFCGEAETEFKAIIESSELPTALISRVKNLYGMDFDRFKDDYHFIINHMSTTQEDVDSALSDVLKREFHATAGTVGPVFFECRIKELFHRICSRIIDCSLKREPYICTNGEFEQLCEEICKCISAEHFEPDYQAFSKNIKPLVLSEPLMSCREYRQLEYCCHGKSSFLSRQIFIFALLLPLPFFFSLLPFGRGKGKGRIFLFLSFFFLKRKYRKRREKDYFSEDREGEKGKRGKEKTLEEKRKKTLFLQGLILFRFGLWNVQRKPIFDG